MSVLSYKHILTSRMWKHMLPSAAVHALLPLERIVILSMPCPRGRAHVCTEASAGIKEEERSVITCHGTVLITRGKEREHTTLATFLKKKILWQRFPSHLCMDFPDQSYSSFGLFQICSYSTE